MSMNFADFVFEQKTKKRSNLILGLKPNFTQLPEWLRISKLTEFGRNWAAVSEAIIAFDKCVIEAVAPHVVGIMPRLSYYQQYGAYGLRALERTIINALNQELIVIIDAGIASYASYLRLAGETFIGNVPGWEGERPSNLHAHATTIIPYYGMEMLEQYVRLGQQTSRGLYILPGSHQNYAQWDDLARLIIGSHGISSLGVLFDNFTYQDILRLENTSLALVLRPQTTELLDEVWFSLSEQAKNKTLICIENEIYDCYSQDNYNSYSEEEDIVQFRFRGCFEAAEMFRKKYSIE